MTESFGEPISAGAAPRGSDELVAKFEQGIDLNRIRDLLSAARDRAGGAGEQICTLNLVAAFFTAAQAERARPALEAAGRLHPCRLIVLVADATAPQESITARVSVVQTDGAIHVERITLTATGRAVRHLESAMTGLLLPELPMVVVWGGRPEGNLLHRAVEAADRIIVDSGARPPVYLSEIAPLLARGAPIGDVAWARIFPWQGIAAEVLDLPNLREHRGNITSARVVCREGLGAEGLLLAGWLKARVPRVDVTVAAEGKAEPFGDPCMTHAEPMTIGQIAAFEFTAPPATFSFRREGGLLLAEVNGDDDGKVVHRTRLPPDQPGRLLALELKLLSGADELYAQSVQEAVKLLVGNRA